MNGFVGSAQSTHGSWAKGGATANMLFYCVNALIANQCSTFTLRESMDKEAVKQSLIATLQEAQKKLELLEQSTSIDRLADAIDRLADAISISRFAA